MTCCIFIQFAPNASQLRIFDARLFPASLSRKILEANLSDSVENSIDLYGHCISIITERAMSLKQAMPRELLMRAPWSRCIIKPVALRQALSAVFFKVPAHDCETRSQPRDFAQSPAVDKRAKRAEQRRAYKEMQVRARIESKTIIEDKTKSHKRRHSQRRRRI